MAIMFLPSCITPMSVAEIRTLSTCHATTLSALRKSLVRNDYEIESETADGLETGFKEPAGDATTRTLHRIKVERLDADSFHFSVESKTRDAQGEHPALDLYLEERRMEVAEIQREVCG